MRTTWHLVRKDVRGLALPVAVWLAFQAGALTWFAQAPGFIATDVSTWLYGYGLWAEQIAIVQALFSFVLVGVLVLEDPARGSDVFWRTRPISGARLLAAKGMAAGLLFVVAPAIVLLPVWLGLGFSAGEAGQAAAKLMRAQLGLVLMGLLAGSLARNLAQHVGLGLGLVVAMVGSMAAGSWLGGWNSELLRWDDPGHPLLVTVQAGLLLLMGAVPALQYLAHRRRTSGAVLALTLPVMFLLGQGWATPRDALVPYALERERSNPVRSDRMIVTPERIRGRRDVTLPTFERREVAGPLLDVAVRPTVARGEIILPVGALGRLSGSGEDSVPVALQSAVRVPDTLVRALAAAGETSGETRGSLDLRRRGEAEAKLPAGSATLDARVFAHAYRGRRVGSMPVREGATLTEGSNRLRIVAVQAAEHHGASHRITLKERETTATSSDGHTYRNRYSFGGRTSKLDYFLLQSGSALYVLEVQDLGGVALSSVAVGGRQLVLPNLPWPEIQQATLIKVRFERTERFAQDIRATGIEITEDAKP